MASRLTDSMLLASNADSCLCTALHGKVSLCMAHRVAHIQRKPAADKQPYGPGRILRRAMSRWRLRSLGGRGLPAMARWRRRLQTDSGRSSSREARRLSATCSVCSRSAQSRPPSVVSLLPLSRASTSDGRRLRPGSSCSKYVTSERRHKCV